ncbi:XRE family transcriptional regulator [Mycobacterium sp. CBMA293]|uniref:Helix-turn-helix protein n=1 Tax=Mycolicibacterium sp. CBMA 213 TaxID=1968788 RepID=A0A1S6GKN1_9MYCO|nr:MULTISPECIES: XRE family transcriptional regulator [unclassified Mycolicibacterium]AQS22416.1 Helix-turn-helix protein [Mycolicibacterium sp. CBMA 213]MUL48473.1 XRE family transcriptional regulator [Mycolicibacterium sp. CBMA 360]MUL62331.1 XRE family transcriptional regulator [Mycolicibacterium sp. CBMA 335]MUM04468.1 hypothetical protein [Mycolicibacterium sp. CBMA 213]MUM14731.1 XRE family transcriptional regulator [Mycolicibacterium sp. CBMA 293]
MHDDAHAAGVTRAGAAFAARRAELRMTVQDVVDSGALSKSALVNFENGRTWPRDGNRDKLERLVGLEEGALTSLYEQGAGMSRQDQTEGLVRAGAAFAKRRDDLNITQVEVAEQKIMSVQALIAFEKGRSWPREMRRAELERLVRWPPGTLASLRNAAATPSPDLDGVSAEPPADPSTLMLDAVKLALTSALDKLKALPADDAPTFIAEARPVMASLRSLQALASRAVRANIGSVSAVQTLEDITACFEDLMGRVAAHPAASLGQKLYVARRKRHLNVQEVADILDMPATTVAAVEADEQELSDDYRERVEQLIRTLTFLKL